MAEIVEAGMGTHAGAELARVAVLGAATEQKLLADQQAWTRCAVQGCLHEGRYPFHGQQACSHQCLELLLRIAVIEEQTRATAAALRARPRVLLGRILIEQGTINEAHLEQALRSQRATGAGKLGCWLKQQVDLPEADFTAALSVQWRCPVFHVEEFTPAHMVSYLPRPLMEEHGALPLKTVGAPQQLSLGFEDHVDYELVSAMERMHGVAVDAGLLTATEFWQTTRDLLSVRFPKVKRVDAASPECMVEAMSRFLVTAGAQDARMVAVHGCYWLRIWMASSKTSSLQGSQTELVPYDILCTPCKATLGMSENEIENAVELATEAMLRIFQEK